MSSPINDLEDGELSSSDEECTIKLNALLKETETNTKIDETSSIEGTDVTSSETNRKRPFESPEPEEHPPPIQTDEVTPIKDLSESQNDQSDLEEGEIFSDDEEAAYYPNLVKSRSFDNATKRDSPKSSNGKRQHPSSPPRKRSKRSPSPSRNEGGYNNRPHYRGGGGNYERKPYPSGRNKDPSRGGGGGRDRRGPARSRDKSHSYSNEYDNPSGRQDRTNEGWEEPQQRHPTLTLDTLETRLMEQRAIFPTPICNPCYSLDEFNYPAPPQWYLRAVSGYNKRMGSRGRGRGGVAWRSGPEEPHRMDVVPNNHGYQQYAPPTTYPRPIPLFDEQLINQTPTPTATPLNPRAYPISDSIPFITPYNNNIRPPLMNIGTFPGMPPPMGIAMTTGHVNMAPPMMPPQAPPTNIATHNPNTTVLPPTTSNSNTLFETNLFDSFPQTQVTNDNSTKNQLTMDVSNQSMEDTNDLVIAKQDEEDEGNSYEDVSPSPAIVPDTNTTNSDECSFNVSTLGVKTLGRKGRQSIFGHSNKKSGVNRQRLPKSLVVSVELKKIHLPGGEEGTDEELDYDDYLDQLNNEEDQEEGEPPLLPPSDPTEGFWIDTNPDSNPLENDFPTVEGGGGEGNAPQPSLRSLIGVDSSVDKSVLTEEGSEGHNQQDGSGNKVGEGNLKRLEKSYWTKKNREQVDLRKATPTTQPAPPPTQEPPGGGQKMVQPCKYYLQGYCIHGDNCQYNHSIPRERKKEMCKFYLQDACDKGDNCIFYHGNFPCKYFHCRHMCYHGDKCKFSHAPLTAEGYELLTGAADPGTTNQVAALGGFLPQDGCGLLTAPPPPQPSPSLLGAVPSILPEPPSHLPPPNYGGPIRPLPPPMAPPPIVLPPGFTATSIAPPTHPFPPINPRGQPLLPPHSNAIQPQTYTDPTTNIFVGNDSNSVKPNVSCNMQLPPSFDVESLFPDEHPQVLPHDLATQLRKVLLDTPSSINEEDKKRQEEEEGYDLYYWEAPKGTDVPSQTYSVSSGGETTLLSSQDNRHEPLIDTRPTGGHFNRPIEPPAVGGLMPTLRPIMGGLVNSLRPPFEPPRPLSFSPLQHDPFQFRGPSPPRHGMGVVGGPGFSNPSTDPRQNAGSRNNIRPSSDPRMDRDPRQQEGRDQLSGPFSTHHHLLPSADTTDQYSNKHNPQYTHNKPHSSIPRSYSPNPHSNSIIPNSAQPLSDGYSIPKTTLHDTPTPPNPWNTDRTLDKPTTTLLERPVDPRKKYSQFKIKPKRQSGPLPELLRDSSILNKPIDIKDLFVNGPAGMGGGISLFGSGSQLDNNEEGENHEYGEIKMRRDSVQTQHEEESNNNETNDSTATGDGVGNEGDVPVVPSYLTHLGISQTHEEETIDSAFGSLMSRKRRLSELTDNGNDGAKDTPSGVFNTLY